MTDDQSRTELWETFLNALIGAILGVVFSMIPLSTVLGGAVASYLEDGDADAGIRVGALAGLIMLIPGVLFLLLLSTLIGVASVPLPAGSGLVLVFGILVGVIYTVGFAAVGGYLVVYLRNEF